MRLLSIYHPRSVNTAFSYYVLKNPTLLISDGNSMQKAININAPLCVLHCCDFIDIIICVEYFWDAVSKVEKKSRDDQERLNTALTRMELVWNKTTTVTDNKHWTARNRNGFTVTVLDFMHVCRRNCQPKHISSYYVWHHGGKFIEGKIERAMADHVWLLRKGWMQVAENSTAVGVQWLKEMM